MPTGCSAHSEVAESLSSLTGLIPLRPTALLERLPGCANTALKCWVCCCVFCSLSTFCSRQTGYSLMMLWLRLKEGGTERESRLPEH